MNDNVAISFYLRRATQSFLQRFEDQKSGWQRCVIYQGRHSQNNLGCGGVMKLFKLSDGRVILTNDLWYDNDSYVSVVPDRALVGYPLNTFICSPLSKEASKSLLELLQHPGRQQKGSHPIWLTKSDMSVEDAYQLVRKFSYPSRKVPQLPQGTERTFQSFTTYNSFSSPENVIITHVKVGSHDLVAFQGPEQLDCVDPAYTPLFFLYHTNNEWSALQKEDTKIESYVYDYPEWTQGSRGSAIDKVVEKKKLDFHTDFNLAYTDYDDHDDGSYEEQFMPTTGWYRTGQGYSVLAMADEQPDYIACDSDCGYCGRCRYL
jgi:hypothetical protein